MCAIIDANVAPQVFGTAKECRQTEAGKEFFGWISEGKGRLVVGGPLLEELLRIGRLKDWLFRARLTGRVVVCDQETVRHAIQDLRELGRCRSDDLHVVALARVSGARLLFSNEWRLIEDFKNKELISSPRGNVYTTLSRRPEDRKLGRGVDGRFTEHHRKVLERSVCRKG